MLAEDEVQHIFPEEEEANEMLVGDIVSALWIPNGKYYDVETSPKSGLTMRCM